MWLYDGYDQVMQKRCDHLLFDCCGNIKRVQEDTKPKRRVIVQ